MKQVSVSNNTNSHNLSEEKVVKNALFKQADYLPFMLGIFIIGGLLVIPFFWGMVGLELSYLEAVPWSLASCVVFLIAFRRSGDISWARAIPALIGLMIIGETYSAMTEKPAFGAGGILGFFAVVICGYTGIGIGKLIRHRNRPVRIGAILTIPFLVLLFWLFFGRDFRLKSQRASSIKPSPFPTIEEKIDSSLWQTYKNNSCSFSFRYPEDKYQVAPDDEIIYGREGNLDSSIKVHFINLMGYEPPKFLYGIKLVDKNKRTHMRIWLFDNSNMISIDSWYSQYGFYPDNFGPSIGTRPEQEQPTQDFPIKNAIGRQVTLPEMNGEGHYVYILKGDRMYFVYLGETSIEGSRILESLTIK
ncbi:MAG: hypothetical protein JW991_01555 [Candidatus Pacebacteria bacterium]|nr:hypothetical protein [Candidatus Paceibacterota bacterium]